MASNPPMPDAEQLQLVASLVTRVEAGDRHAFDALIPLLYDELRAIAHRQRARWTGDETLGTTALVNEAYLKLAEQSAGEYVSRSHLLAVASRAMRQILVDYARTKRRTKRGGGAEHVPLEDVEALLGDLGGLSSAEQDAVVALSESLDRLQLHSERHARIIECRFFGGLSIEETAAVLGIAPATVKRSWSVAQAWLRRDLEQANAA